MNKSQQQLSKMENTISRKEAEHAEETINLKAPPMPKLMTKDHKKKDRNGNCPTQSTAPATNFTSGFPKLRCKGIKGMFDRNNIKHDKSTALQASDLKKNMEKMNLKKNDVTIALIDVASMHPLIKHNSVEKAVNCFAKTLNNNDEKMI